MKKQHRLIIFVKAPIPGQVKTRLAKQTGLLQAARIYRQLLSRLISRLQDLNTCDIEIHCSPDTRHPFLRQCAQQLNACLHKQVGNDLGMRMFNSLRSGLKRSEICVLIGSDMPEISANDINASINCIKGGTDVVFLPAEDGGYGLVAMKTVNAALFRNMRWSQSDVLEKTLARAIKLGLEYKLLPAKTDIDSKLDFINYSRRNVC